MPTCQIRSLTLSITLSITILASLTVSGLLNAQDEDWDVDAQIELGASFTSGNTDDENIRLRSRVEADRHAWGYRMSFDGFRSSSQNELAAERFYTYGLTTYNYDEDNFSQVRASHEQDRFSGFERQTDVSVSYGQIWLRSRDDMELDYTIGAGLRTSKSSTEDFNEAIIRLSTLYSWDITDSSRFYQELSTDAGERVAVTRSETGIESDIMQNLSMKFSIRLRHQNSVPDDRENLDTETALTLLIRL